MCKERKGEGWVEGRKEVRTPCSFSHSAAQKFCPLPAWKPYNCTLEMPCVPIYNHIENNTYCNTTKFTNLTPDDIKNWLETVNNNVEKC